MKKAMSCLLSFLPGITLLISFISVFAITIMGADTMSTGETVLALLMVLIAFVAVILTYGVMIFYIVKACKNPALSGGMKALWIALLYCLNVFVFPVFWFMYIKNE